MPCCVMWCCEECPATDVHSVLRCMIHCCGWCDNWVTRKHARCNNKTYVWSVHNVWLSIHNTRSGRKIAVILLITWIWMCTLCAVGRWCVVNTVSVCMNVANKYGSVTSRLHRLQVKWALLLVNRYENANCPMNINRSPLYRFFKIALSVLQAPILGHMQATGQKDKYDLHTWRFIYCVLYTWWVG